MFGFWCLGVSVGEGQGLAVLGPVGGVQCEEALEVVGGVDQGQAAGVWRQGLVGEVEADGDAGQQMLALQVGQPVGLMALNPFELLFAYDFCDSH